VSFLPFHPSRFGILVPEDPRTGVALVDQSFYFDQVVSVSTELPREVSRHPFEFGSEAAADNVSDDSEQVQVVAVLVDKPSSLPPDMGASWRDRFEQMVADRSQNLILGGFVPIDRAVKRLRDFLALRDRKAFLSVALPGRPPLISQQIGRTSYQPRASGGAIDVTFTLTHARVVRLRVVSSIPDADLKAAGLGGGELGTVEIGTFGGFGATP
jgi:hypothetical protein